jgi:hypothetical protein
VVRKVPRTAFYFTRSATTGFAASISPYRNRVSFKEAFAGPELCDWKLSCTVLRGLGDRKVARLLGTVNYIEVMLSRDTGMFPTSPSAGMTEEYHNVPKRVGNVAAPYWFPTPVGKPYRRVALTTQASVAQREHAYAYFIDVSHQARWWL